MAKHIHFVFFAFLVSIFLGNSLGCGVLTHTEIVHRSVQKISAGGFLYEPPNSGGMLDVSVVPQVYRKYQAAFQAGAPYPDSFYAGICFHGKYADVSEDTHWGGFMNASINYIRKQPEPWDEATWRLVAFIYGVSSHQIADVLWHNLGDKVKQGFLQVMANSDFHGVFSAAHPVGDEGADFIGSKLWNNSFIKLSKWEVPVEQLHEIYTDFYGYERISRVAIEECSLLLYLARLAEYFLSYNLYSGVYRMSPFLSEQLNDYYKGGINDMVAWTTQYFQLVTDMINKGTKICDFSDRREDMFDLKCNSTKTPFTQDKTTINQKMKRHQKQNSNDLLISDLANKAVVEKESFAGKTFLTFSLSVTAIKLMEDINNYYATPTMADEEIIAEPDSSVISTLNPFSNFGKAITQLSFNSTKCLVVGAPDWSESNRTESGKVFLVDNSELGKNITFGTDPAQVEQIIVLSPPDETFSSFGCSLAAVDMDGDGHDELLVGASSSGGRTSTTLSYIGSVVMYSNVESTWLHRANWNGTSFDENLGFAMEAIDGQDNYLLTSSPFANDQSGILQKISLTNGKQVVAEGQQPGEWFGYSLSVEPRLDPKYAYVGAPNHRLCASQDCAYNADDVQSVGAVYQVDLETGKVEKILQGSEQFKKTGWTVKAISTTLLAVSSPGTATPRKTNSLTGDVIIFEKEQNGTFLEKAKLSGDKSLEQFGYSLNVDHDNNLLMVGSPLWRSKIGFDPIKNAGAEFGKIYLYDLSTLQLVGQLEGKSRSSRFGSSSYVTTDSKNESMLVVSAPTYSSTTTSQSGAVFVTPWDSKKKNT